ncbi:MAG: hypothetical protein FWF46_00740 [Oscillospiraceae bacterium]|nr:hypothetical protein [Oscillospiraceae bacterium]
MTEKEFRQALRRGLGNAIIELRSNENRIIYKDIVQYYCLRDISYDSQSEGTKGFYLYSVICALEERKYFEHIIINKFMSHCSDILFLQLSDILFCYANDGSELAKNTFRKKYEYFATKYGKLSRNISKNIDEGFQWNEVAEKLFYIDGFSAFKRYAQDVGENLNKNPNNRKIYYDFLIDRGKEVFGEKRVETYMDKMCEKSNAIKALIDVLNEDKLLREQHDTKIEQEKITVNSLIEIIRKMALVGHSRANILRYRSTFMRKASETEILELANAVLDEENETVKGLLLDLLWRKPFPLDITPLLQYTQSDNESLVESSIKVLSAFKDNRIHALSITLLQSKGINSFALSLLKNNYKKSDDNMIYSLLKKSAKVSHHVQQCIRDIYTHHRSINVFDTLFYVYQKGECTFCRYGIVEAMNHCNVLSDEILKECLYDSYEDTRKFAKKLIEKRKL